MRTWVGMATLALAASVAHSASYEASVTYDDAGHDLSGFNADQTSSNSATVGSTSTPVTASGGSGAPSGYAYAASAEDALKSYASAGGGGMYSAESSASVTAQGLMFSGADSNVTSALNVQLDGHLDADTFSGSYGSPSNSASVSITYMIYAQGGNTPLAQGTGAYTVTVADADEDGTGTASGDFQIPGTYYDLGGPFGKEAFAGFGVQVTTNPFTVPTGVPLTLVMQLSTSADLVGSATLTADFADTLQFASSDVFENVNGEAGFNASCPDAGIQNNSVAITPEPCIAGGALGSLVLWRTLRRRRDEI
jgi:hypothetical protein